MPPEPPPKLPQPRMVPQEAVVAEKLIDGRLHHVLACGHTLPAEESRTRRGCRTCFDHRMPRKPAVSQIEREGASYFVLSCGHTIPTPKKRKLGESFACRACFAERRAADEKSTKFQRNTDEKMDLEMESSRETLGDLDESPAKK